jgi:antitoxin component YwqK of YwqJK toxin-antitoxin module
MDIKHVLNSDKKYTKVLSRWSNGAIHFEVEYDKLGDWKSGKITIYYMNGQIKSVFFQNKGVMDGEAINFESDEETMFNSEEEVKNFLNE